jgi:formate dehydrogenase alpha subunit
MTQMVTLTIDGREVTLPRGSTISEAAEKAGVKIPSLCHDRRLIPFGSCRVCMVEVKGREGNLIPACFNPARNGMEVLTATPGIIEARKTQLQLILLHHPLECPTCDQAGACTLQDLVYEYGITDNPYRLERPAGGITAAVKEKLLIGSMARRESRRCILCGRCVRICEELQGVKEIDFVGRGFRTTIGTDFDRDLQCEFCGQCISTCPVGALTTALISHHARQWELKKAPSLCAYCGCGCTIILGIKENRVRTVTSDYAAGANQGNLCVKGRYGWEYIHSDERLTTPLMRKEGRLAPCSWEAALQETARGLERIKEAYGADAIGVIGSGRLTNEEAYLLQKLTRAALGSNNVDSSGGFTYQGLFGLKECLGYAAMTNSLAELRDSEVILAVRSDPQETHPMVKLEVIMALNRNRAFLIAADSYETWLHARAHCAIIYRPGTEVAFLNGLLHVIFKERLEDGSFIAERTRGCDGLRKSVASFDPATVESITGVPAAILVAAARKYAGSQKASILISSGLGLRGDERGIARASANLALATGNIGTPSSGVNILAEKSNSQGVLDMGLVPAYLPGYRDLQDQGERRTFERAWNARLSSTPGLNALEMLRGAENGAVKALYLVGENPLLSYPDRHRTLRALQRAELVVVQDMFLSETAAAAQVVLPVLSLPEKEGTLTSTERRVQKFDRVLDPVGGGKSDCDIIIALAHRLGYEMSYQHPRQVLQEIAMLVPFYSGISWDRIPHNGIQWPCNSEVGQGTAHLYQAGFPQGRAVFTPVPFTPLPAADDRRLPFYLITVSSLFHSGCLSFRARGLQQVSPAACAELNPSDAARLRITSGDPVLIASAQGSVTVASKISDRTPPGSVLMPYYCDRLRVNVLTTAASPLTRVSVEKT